MGQSKIQDMRSNVDALLDSTKISKAINQVEKMLEVANIVTLKNKLDAVRQTYRYMLHYLMEGTPDDSRELMLAEINENLRSLADAAVREKESIDNPDYYYSVLRFNKLRREHLTDIIREYGNSASELALADAAGNDSTDLRIRMERDLKRLFDALLISFGEDSEYHDLGQYLLSGYADMNVVAQSLSATTLSLLKFYDKGKFNMLFDVYENTEDNKIAARALVGIILAMMANGNRISSNPKIMARLSLWNDSLETYRRLHEILRIIVGTRDTERVTNKMRNEVIPELMKLRPEIIKSLRENGGEPDAAMLVDNPEWEEILNKSDITKKMQELSDMQSDGADLMMVTFSNLKQFPFFNTASNWFLPFDSRHTELKLEEDIRKFVDMLHDIGPMVCDSDLYSLALAANRISEAQRQMMSSQLTANLENIKEESKAIISRTNAPEFDSEALKVVRDLYRFFKLFRKREGFFDPFARPLQFRELPVVGAMMSEDEVLRLFGEFYFKRGYYADALPLFEAIGDGDSSDSTLWEKIGFCHQSAARYSRARDAYEKAALLKAPGPWLTNKLAYVNRRLGNYEAASEYYAKALDMDSENLSLIMNAGNMQLEIGDITGALAHFYHANYIVSDNPKILRAIAWTELLNGNFQKASDYYTRIIAIQPTASDYLNAGHAALLLKNYKEAANFYGLSATINESEFELAFNADLKTLVQLGADATTAELIVDSTQNGA